MTSSTFFSDSTITLANGVSMPRLGLGVFRAARGAETRSAVRAALDLGYRHIDTAQVYGNEAEVGAAIRDSGIPRQEVFVTTKLWNDDQGYDTALAAFDASLARLDLDYVDLYLLHWPVPERRLDSWRALERLLDEGRCRAIGVSNFLVRHLDELLGVARVRPHVNQVELSPFHARADLAAFCSAHAIQLEAYSPLTKGLRLAHPTVVEIAARHGKSPAQILIRWSLERGFVVIPKSTRPGRIEENAQVFDFALAAADMAALDALDEGLVTGWDSAQVP